MAAPTLLTAATVAATAAATTGSDPGLADVGDMALLLAVIAGEGLGIDPTLLVRVAVSSTSPADANWQLDGIGPGP